MNTRFVVAVGVIGAVLFGVAALALSSSGGKEQVEAGQVQPGGSQAQDGSAQQQAATATATAERKTPTATPEPPDALDREGAVARATPPVPPDESYLVANGSEYFTVPVRAWSGLGDRFGVERAGGMMHGGLDFKLDGYPDAEVIASCTGMVTGSDRNATLGLYMAIDCGDGWTTVYANLTQVLARRGDQVYGGQTLIANAGPSHLHFELRWTRVPVDPELYLDLKDVPTGDSQTVSDGRSPGEVPPTPTPSITPSSTATSTSTATATPVRPTSTPVPSSNGGGGTQPPTPTPAPPTATSVPTETPTPEPTATPTPIPPTPTATHTPTPMPPTPTRTPTPRPVLQ